MSLEFEISPTDLKKISSYVKPLHLNKGDVFIREGVRNNKIGIMMMDGLMISTYISKKGKEEVSRIYSVINGNTIISNHESFYYERYSTENIIAVEKTQLMVLTKDDLKKILIKYSELEKLAKSISEISYINAVERIKEFQSCSARERVKSYYEKYSELFFRLNKQQMASFLGVNRNDFSKILKEIKDS